MIYNPDKGMVTCPHCGGEETQEKKTGDGPNYNSMEKCLNCGAPLKPGTYTSAEKCEFCGHYLIYDERVSGNYKPQKMVPFTISKQKAMDIMKETFKKKVFAPSDFLSTQRLESITGIYVPHFLYDYGVLGDYHANATKVRTWTSGDTEYTETSYFEVVRKMRAKFDDVPVDASEVMPDDPMDLMEPYDYKALDNFREDNMSGFYSEIYNKPADELAYRAEKKVTDDSLALMRNSVSGYTTVNPDVENVAFTSKSHKYALMPVWQYKYSYKGKDFTYFINGQTGKLVGEAPISKGKIFAYGATIWVLLMITTTLAGFVF